MQLINQYIHTDLGSNLWDQLFEDNRQPQAERTRLERLKLFLERYPDVQHVVCTLDLIQGFRILCPSLILTEFPNNIEDFYVLISAEPRWFLAGSQSETGVIGCEISLRHCEEVIQRGNPREFNAYSLLLSLLTTAHFRQSPVLDKIPARITTIQFKLYEKPQLRDRSRDICR